VRGEGEIKTLSLTVNVGMVLDISKGNRVVLFYTRPDLFIVELGKADPLLAGRDGSVNPGIFLVFDVHELNR
jgi:hypothetical protein